MDDFPDSGTGFGDPTTSTSPDGGGWFDFLHGVPVIFAVLFFVVVLFVAFVLVMIVVRLARYASATPERAPGRVVAKRMKVWGGSGDMSASTSYFVTVEAPDGSRRELRADGRLFGLVTEGDEGLVTSRLDVLKAFDRGASAQAPGPITS